MDVEKFIETISKKKEDEVLRIRKVLSMIDPIDSAYFDISVVRHSVESGKMAQAIEYLGQTACLGELKRALDTGLITQDEYKKYEEKINSIREFLNENKIDEAWFEIVRLQDELAVKAYTTFMKLYNESIGVKNFG